MDHRKKALWICRVEDLPEGASHELRAVVRAANSHRPVYVLWTMGIMVGAILLVTVLRHGAQYDYRELAICMVIGALVSVLISIPLTRRFARRAGKACLEAGLCAACGYLVAGSEVGADGCVTCPECGAAWLSENLSGAGALPQ